MPLKGPTFPKIKAALKSLIKDKTKEHTVKITPFGATKHLIVGKTYPLLLGINIEETYTDSSTSEKRNWKALFIRMASHTCPMETNLESDVMVAIAGIPA